MIRIERFADDAGLVIIVDRHCHDSGWSARFSTECGCGSSIWLKESQASPQAMGETALQALRDLVDLCRGKTIVINDIERHEIKIPADLSTY